MTDGVSDLLLNGCFALLSGHLLDLEVSEVCVRLDSQTRLIHQQTLKIPVISSVLKGMQTCGVSGRA